MQGQGPLDIGGDLRQLKVPTMKALADVSFRVSPSLTLVPVGEWVLDRPEILQNLVDWRYRNGGAFFAAVPATLESMVGYLKRMPIGEDTRVLFLLRWRNQYVGHLGLSSVLPPTAEIDNVIRGCESYSGMMGEALGFVVQWSAYALGIKTLYLRVKETNVRAIHFYARFGFKTVEPDNAPIFFPKIPRARQPGELLMVSSASKSANRPSR